MLKRVFRALYKLNKNKNIMLESSKKWSNQLIKSLKIVISNIKLLILVTLTTSTSLGHLASPYRKFEHHHLALNFLKKKINKIISLPSNSLLVYHDIYHFLCV
jgi:hypothetical protein